MPFSWQYPTLISIVPCVLFLPLYEASTCCWFWFSPAARSALRATLPAPPWLSPSTLTLACESYHLGKETSEEMKRQMGKVNSRGR